MRRKAQDEQWTEQPRGGAGFLTADAPAEQRLTDPDLRDRVARLEIQVMQQYTAMAAYATIGQQQVETAQTELRGDIDRSQATLLGLIDRSRREVVEQLEALRMTSSSSGGATGDSANAARLDVLEQRFDALANALERSVQNQMALAEQLTTLVEDKMQRDGWLMADGTAGALSLR